MDTAVRSGGYGGGVDRDQFVTAVVDVSVIAGLVLLGNIEHGGNPIAEPFASVETIAPFVIGWLAVSLLAGVYTRDRVQGSHRYRQMAVTWIAAANVGLMLRASSLFDGGATWPFPLVITGTGLVALLGWRFGFGLYRSATA
ncbi:DUF3054 domain-containing protein [Natrinema halophilum]|uniref:DUF3054 domain-containing protein n=1 Tax=Natrinema halophilum TaxID=1699371 RepID=A0A7D5GFT8_9EURY|nr:DUF3054 domain-containing protein [Natrinema halophilum]QLG47808.1 DUF3054 domain-containing protein [Natrinema halophilum]